MIDIALLVTKSPRHDIDCVMQPYKCIVNSNQRIFISLENWVLTLKHWEMHGCVVSTVATDALVLKHQAISSNNAD